VNAVPGDPKRGEGVEDLRRRADKILKE